MKNHPISGPVACMMILSVCAHAQSPQCPSSVVAAGEPFDLAGAIRQAGSAQALLANTEQALREMSTDCSAFANAEVCRVTKAVTRDVNLALKTCLAKASVTAKTPPPVQTSSALSQTFNGLNSSLYNTEDNSDGNQIFRQMAAAGAPFRPKNPQQDHTGEPCTYFTRPLVRPDGGGLNAYDEGAHVSFGKFYYVCRNRRWMSIGPSSAFANAQEHAAERLEQSAFNVQIYEKE